jgi:hypothetical protein
MGDRRLMKAAGGRDLSWRLAGWGIAMKCYERLSGVEAPKLLRIPRSPSVAEGEENKFEVGSLMKAAGGI